MHADAGRPRLVLALLVAPLAGPIALYLGTVLHGLVTTSMQPPAQAQHPGPLEVAVGLWFFGYAFLLLGSPLSYGTTLVVVLPLFLLLRAADRLTWWLLTLVAALAGAAVLPPYLHWLDLRGGSSSFFPGAGLLAGAAAGWAFWFLATRPRGRRAAE